MKKSKLFEKIKAFLVKNKEKFTNIRDFLVFITGYGLILNYLLHFLFGLKFTILTLFAYGILFYFIKEEFTSIIKRMR